MSTTSISPLSYTDISSTRSQNAHASSAATQQSSQSGANIGGVSANESTFLTLLVTQLKNQDPLKPTDSTQFVSELAQFSSLEQLININQNVGTMTSTVSGTGSASTATNALTGAAGGSSNSAATSSTSGSDYNTLLNSIG